MHLFCGCNSTNYADPLINPGTASLPLQRPRDVVAIKAITKKNLAKSQNLLGKEIKILKVSATSLCGSTSSWLQLHSHLLI